MLYSSAGYGVTSFGPMLERMCHQAGAEVDRSLRALEQIIALTHRNRPKLSLYVLTSVEQLYRTYLALAWEVSRLSTGSDATGLERLTRSQVVQRVHQKAGDFQLIGKLCETLRAYREDAPVTAIAQVLEGWTDREVHLFGMLVPLAHYAEEVRRDLTQLAALAPAQAASVAARRRDVEKTLAAPFRQLGFTAHQLYQFSQKLSAFTAAPVQPAPKATPWPFVTGKLRRGDPHAA